jgi:hypothetical protein
MPFVSLKLQYTIYNEDHFEETYTMAARMWTALYIKQ